MLVQEGGAEGEGVSGIREILEKRVAEGMWGARSGEGEVGGRIAVLEM